MGAIDSTFGERSDGGSGELAPPTTMLQTTVIVPPGAQVSERSIELSDGRAVALHFTDAEGNPAGGVTESIGVQVRWQNGPLGRGETRKAPNGAFVEDLIQIAIDRIRWYQESQFACDENAWAIAALEAAIGHLESRTARRENAGIEGTHDPD